MPKCKDDAIAAIFRKSLQFLRGRDYDITDELNEMIDRKQKKQSLMTSSSGSWTWIAKRLMSPAYLRPFMCVGVIKIIMTWGGINILMMFMVNVFRESKSSVDPELAPVFVGIVRVLSSGFSCLVMGNASRKILYMVCMAIITTGNLILATFSYLKTQQVGTNFNSSIVSYVPNLKPVAQPKN